MHKRFSGHGCTGSAAVNADAVFAGTKAAIAAMRRSGSGSIVNVSSTTAIRAAPFMTSYSASKAAMIQFSAVAAMEVARDNIRVNCLTPSIVRGTPLYDELMAHPFASKIFAKAEQMASLGVVEADELAQLAVFLASPEAAKLSGQCFAEGISELLILRRTRGANRRNFSS